MEERLAGAVRRYLAARAVGGAVGCGSGTPSAETQEPSMSKANPPEIEMNDRAWEGIMQKVKELEKEIAEMEKGLPPDLQDD
jgi:hypothetical protein